MTRPGEPVDHSQLMPPAPYGLPSIEQPAGDDPLGPPADVRARMAARGLAEQPAAGPQPGLDRAAIHEALGGGPGRHRTVKGDYNAARYAMAQTEARQLLSIWDAAPSVPPGSGQPSHWMERAASILRMVAAGE